ncbi:MAG: HAD-IIA family hydrolase [Anaerolineae bacterium]|jgi:4-nitrophenyl phosphatase|nr:HAD-IIA family hydrolase [Anaerolineae bacterium]
MALTGMQALIMDMDGVLWRGDEALPGLAAFFAWLRRAGRPFVLATNNSSRPPAQYVQKLAGLGVPDILPQQIITSATATAIYLRARYPAGTRVHVVGMDGVRQALLEADFALVEEDAAVVVAGVDFELTYDKAKRAALMIRAGADFVGTNPDATFPTPEGLIPGAGSILALLETAGGKAPLVIGKPEPAMFEVALRRLGTLPEQTLMVGDRLDTDIFGAYRAGLKTALVLTGVSRREDVAHSPVLPDAIFEDLPALQRACETLV